MEDRIGIFWQYADKPELPEFLEVAADGSSKPFAIEGTATGTTNLLVYKGVILYETTGTVGNAYSGAIKIAPHGSVLADHFHYKLHKPYKNDQSPVYSKVEKSVSQLECFICKKVKEAKSGPVLFKQSSKGEWKEDPYPAVPVKAILEDQEPPSDQVDGVWYPVSNVPGTMYTEAVFNDDYCGGDHYHWIKAKGNSDKPLKTNTQLKFETCGICKKIVKYKSNGSQENPPCPMYEVSPGVWYSYGVAGVGAGHAHYYNKGGVYAKEQVKVAKQDCPICKLVKQTDKLQKQEAKDKDSGALYYGGHALYKIKKFSAKDNKYADAWASKAITDVVMGSKCNHVHLVKQGDDPPKLQPTSVEMGHCFYCVKVSTALAGVPKTKTPKHMFNLHIPPGDEAPDSEKCEES